MMESQSQPYPIKIFLDKIKYFNFYNICFGLWVTAEMIFFCIVTSQISCSKMRNLFIIWTCSYAAELLVPIGSYLIARYSKYYRAGYAYIGIVATYKLGYIVSILAVAWRHVGLCYIPYGLRVIMILTNCLEFVCLFVELILLMRIKTVNREVLLNNLVKKKVFAEN